MSNVRALLIFIFRNHQHAHLTTLPSRPEFSLPAEGLKSSAEYCSKGAAGKCLFGVFGMLLMLMILSSCGVRKDARTSLSYDCLAINLDSGMYRVTTQKCDLLEVYEKSSNSVYDVFLRQLNNKEEVIANFYKNAAEDTSGKGMYSMSMLGVDSMLMEIRDRHSDSVFMCAVMSRLHDNYFILIVGFSMSGNNMDRNHFLMTTERILAKTSLKKVIPMME